MSGWLTALAAVTVAALVVAAVLAMSVRRVPEHERIVVYRLGRSRPDLVRGPGLVWLRLIGFVDEPIRVDLRERTLELRHETLLTGDGRRVAADLVVRWRVLDPYLYVSNAADAATAIRGLSIDWLREIAADRSQQDLLDQSDQLEQRLRPKLVDALRRIGSELSGLQLRAVVAIDSTMHRASGGPGREDVPSAAIRRRP